MKEFDALLYELEVAYKRNVKCEDGELYIKGGLKYAVHDLLLKYDKKFMKKLYKELEYREED